MGLKVRSEKPEDFEAIDRINEDAFGGVAEARLVNLLRQREPRSISLVAVEGDEIVGHIMFSPMTVEDSPVGKSFAGMGPMAVAPAHQKQGVGGELIRTGLEKCRKAGYHAVAVLGHPEYYVHFGFAPAEAYDIGCEFNVPRGVFMVHEVKPGTLAAVRGCKLFYRPEFREL
jgi:putative acetyltransferase